jgi:hypothetical protein
LTDIDPDFLAELRQAEAASRARAMSRDAKQNLLKRSGWRPDEGNLWKSRGGLVTSFGDAVQTQIFADLNRTRRR